MFLKPLDHELETHETKILFNLTSDVRKVYIQNDKFFKFWIVKKN